jgi:peptidylprolyl isomerase
MFALQLTKWMSAAVLVAALVFMMTENSDAQETTTTSSGLQYIEHEVGSGDAAKTGDSVDVHYTGWLYNDGEKGDKFDSSVDRGQTFSFPLGAGRVIGGWDEGVAGMQTGGKRTLIIPPALGYGASGAGGVIPPNATLMFDVELIAIK